MFVLMGPQTGLHFSAPGPSNSFRDCKKGARKPSTCCCRACMFGHAGPKSVVGVARMGILGPQRVAGVAFWDHRTPKVLQGLLFWVPGPPKYCRGCRKWAPGPPTYCKGCKDGPLSLQGLKACPNTVNIKAASYALDRHRDLGKFCTWHRENSPGHWNRASFQ